jgi:hypothetical protein
MNPQLTEIAFILDRSGSMESIAPDAIGRTIDQIGDRLARTREAERPGKVIVAIFTDGLENASEHFTWKEVAAKIRHQTEGYKWEFLFLGANQDAIATAANLNIGGHNSANILNTDAKFCTGTSAVSRKITSGRAFAAAKAALTPQQQNDLHASVSDLVGEEEEKMRAKERPKLQPRHSAAVRNGASRSS